MTTAAGYSSLPKFGHADSRTRSPQFAVRRPWRELVAHPSSYSIPHSFRDFASRFNRNLAHFRANYALLALSVLFLSLLYHPASIMVFLLASVFWYILYFHRHEPIVVFNRSIDDRAVLLALGVLTLLSLVLTGAWLNVLVSVLIGAAAVVLHAAFREAEDLFLDEDEIAAAGGLESVVGARF